MASSSLYRKHRPQRFGEFVGQEHVTSTLRQALLSDTVGHAYLFSGPRGTGKTTAARVFARALNCLDLADDGEPCGKCGNCLCFTAEGITFPDLFELDAASNNGVENVRDLIQSVNVGMAGNSRRKVYLIDEVHMLSTPASNALLKTLEEPPAYVVFILATTDPQKVLATVRSRTQHFDFSLLTPDQLRELVNKNLELEGKAPDADAIDLIVRKAAGSGRDSLSLLDQALALGNGQLDLEAVRSMLGTTDLDRRAAVLRAIVAEDAGGAIAAVHDALATGVDVRRLADDLLLTLRDAFVRVAAAGRVPYDGPPADLPVLDELAESYGLAGLTRGIELLGATIVDIRGLTVPDPRLLLEVAVVRLARRDSRASVDALADRVERLEQRLADGATATGDTEGGRAPLPARGPSPSRRAAAPVEPATQVPSPAPAAAEPEPSAPSTRSGPRTALGAHRRRPEAPAAPAADDAAARSDAVAPAPTPVVVAAAGEPVVLTLDDVIVAWSRSLDGMRPPTRASVQDAQPIAVEGDTITFGVADDGRANMIKKKFREGADEIRAMLAEHLGATPKFKVVEHDFGTANALAPRSADPDMAPPPPSDDDVDPTDLVDAPRGAGPVDSATRLVEAFPGAEIVEERPRG